MSPPTKYRPNLGPQILERMAEGLSLTAAAAELGIHRQRVYEWAERYEDFAELVALARCQRQAYLERRLLTATAQPVVTSTIFALKNASPDDWKADNRIEVAGAGGGPIRIQWGDGGNGNDPVSTA